MGEEKISSSESEGAFNEFINEQLEEVLDHIINEGDVDMLGDSGSDIIVEMDDIQPPKFVYGDEGGAGAGGRGPGPGNDSKRIRFSLPFDKFMDLVAERLSLPNLVKEGQGRIKEVSYEFKTFGQAGVLLDKKRTFKRALRSSIGTGTYRPQDDEYEVLIRRRDRRYKLPERVEKPRYKAVVFYMGDISYSTYGERLKLEKRVVNFIHSWLNYNYGADNVDHRFVVHDSEAYEVMAEQFYDIANAGGTRAAIAFDLVAQIAINEYDPMNTNFYGFYFGDGEIFEDDAKEIIHILEKDFRPIFNRVGVVEVKPSSISHLHKCIADVFDDDSIIRLGKLTDKGSIIDVIKVLFGS